MEILNRIYENWRYIMDNKSDPRTRNWFMMTSPLPTIAISAAYIFTVKVNVKRLFNYFSYGMIM